MAEARYWRCPNSNCRDVFVSCDLPVCPECQTQQPVFLDKDPRLSPAIDEKAPPEPAGDNVMASKEPTFDVRKIGNQHPTRQEQSSQEPDRSQRLESHQAGGTEEHRAEEQRGTEQQKEQQLCHECGYALEKVSKFCPDCGTPLACKSPHQHTKNTADSSTVQDQTQTPECYFCRATLHTTDSGESQCLRCRKKQPEPKGPPCINGCGVRLIIPGAKSCARCGSSQLRTPKRPADVSADSQHATGYGYPNNPPSCMESSVVSRHQYTPQFQYTQQFGLQAEVYATIHLPQHQTKYVQLPGPSHSTTGSIQLAEHGTSDQLSETPVTDGGKSTGSPTIPDDITPVGHPASALKVDKQQDKTGLQKPIQESSAPISSSITRLQDASHHSLHVDDNNGLQKVMDTRKRKYEVDSGGSRKQNRLENNKHVGNGQQSSDVDPTVSFSESLGKTSVNDTASSGAVTLVISSTNSTHPLPTSTTGDKPSKTTSSGDSRPPKTSSVSIPM